MLVIKFKMKRLKKPEGYVKLKFAIVITILSLPCNLHGIQMGSKFSGSHSKDNYCYSDASKIMQKYNFIACYMNVFLSSISI